MTDRPPNETRVLLLAPTAKDAAASRALLEGAGLTCHACCDMADVCAQFADGAGALVIPEEAVLNSRGRELARALKEQPAWSSVPVILLTAAGPDSAVKVRTLLTLGDVTLLNRPLAVVTFVSAVKAALRDRERQYQVRDHLAELRQAREAARVSREQLRLALEAARMGTWHWEATADEHVRDANLNRLLGLPAAETRQSLADFLSHVHPDDRPAVRAAFDGSARAARHLSIEFRVVWPDGAVRWLRDQGDVVETAGSRHLAGACLDITALKEAEAALREARDRLEEKVAERTAELVLSQERALQAERLAAIGQTVTALAHEGRNALQRATANITRLSWRVEGRSEESDLAARAQQALGDLERLFDDVRSYAAPILLDYQPCDLGRLWREAWARQAGAAQRQARLEEGAVPADLSCEADPFRLGQVFANLFANALEARPDPVRVTVACEETTLDGGPALRVAVRDNGPGFPEVQRRRAFEPFLTTKAKGTGLGLAICKRLVEAHGGQIALSPDTPGAEVVVTLPRKRK